MKNKIVMVLFVLFLGMLTQPVKAELISKDSLTNDVKQLASIIESVHPDPYLAGGGKIAFHRRLHNVLEQIPDSGMTKYDFYQLLEPLVASVKDAHTNIMDPYPRDPYSPGGIPLYFETADIGLYVAAIFNEEHKSLLGARLKAIEGLPMDEIVERYRLKRGAENDYYLYRNLGTQGVLLYGYSLKALIPEWVREDLITVQLCLPNGKDTTVDLTIPEKIDWTAVMSFPTSNSEIVNEYMVQMQRSDIFYQFMDSTRQTCWLVIRDLSTYREAFEVCHSYGIESQQKNARTLYQRYNGTPPPEDYKEVLAGLPSATEIIRSMVEKMKSSQTKHLIVDLSQNGGGSSLLGNIITYFLYGKDTLLSIKGKMSEIVKYSHEYFEVFPSPTLEEMNTGRSLPLDVSDYDFTADYSHSNSSGIEEVKSSFKEMLDRMPTFQAEYESGIYESYYQPANVMVLCDAGTFSSAYTVMYYLKQAGAEISGIPSSQAGNCFGDIIRFQLTNSGLKYTVSRKYFELFPNDQERGRILMPDNLLTYDKMVSYNFDPMVGLRFIMDLLAERESGRQAGQ